MSEAELFDYRLASLHGWLDPEAMKRAMPLRVYHGWQQYYFFEPWGTWRDNMHAALIAREIRRVHVKNPPKLEDYLLVRPEEPVDPTSGLVSAFTVIGKTSTPEESAAIRKAARARRKRK